MKTTAKKQPEKPSTETSASHEELRKLVVFRNGVWVSERMDNIKVDEEFRDLADSSTIYTMKHHAGPGKCSAQARKV